MFHSAARSAPPEALRWPREAEINGDQPHHLAKHVSTLQLGCELRRIGILALADNPDLRERPAPLQRLHHNHTRGQAICIMIAGNKRFFPDGRHNVGENRGRLHATKLLCVIHGT